MLSSIGYLRQEAPEMRGLMRLCLLFLVWSPSTSNPSCQRRSSGVCPRRIHSFLLTVKWFSWVSNKLPTIPDHLCYLAFSYDCYSIPLNECKDPPCSPFNSTVACKLEYLSFTCNLPHSLQWSSLISTSHWPFKGKMHFYYWASFSLFYRLVSPSFSSLLFWILLLDLAFYHIKKLFLFKRDHGKNFRTILTF